jgi:hypothetical protein
MRTRRPRSIHIRGLLVISTVVVAAAACNDNGTLGVDDPAVRGATVGEIEALVADMPDGTSERQQFINMPAPDGARLRLRFVNDPATSLSTGDRVGVWGDRLGDEFVVSRHILLPSDDTSVTSALIGAPAKPQTAVFVIVDVGGGSNVTNAMATSSVFSPGNNFASVYDKLSFGIMKMGGDVQGPFSYPMSTCDYNGLKNAVKPMVSGTYNHYMWYFGSKVSDCAWSGIGSEGNLTRPQSDAWYNASTGCTVLVQEVGHNMGWMHSSTLACPGATFADDPTTCKDSEYGNRMTPMGSGCGMLNAHDLWYAQLIGGCNGVKVTASGTFNLFPLETACNGIQAIQIPMVKTGRMAKPEQGNNNQPLKNYYLEYRTKTGLDANITSAVYVYAGDDIHASTKTSNWSWLLDMNPSTTTFDGLAAGGSFTDPTGEIKVTVMSADTSKAVVQIDVQGGAGAAPTCIDNTTVEAPGPVDCGSGPTTGTGGAGGAGGATGAGGSTTGSAGRGGSIGSAGRGGSTGSAGRGGTTGTVGTGGSAAGAAGRGGTPGGVAGSTGTAGTTGTTGRGGATGAAGNIGIAGAAGMSGSAGSIGTTGRGGATGSAAGVGGATGTATGAAGAGTVTGAAGSATSGNAGASGLGDGPVSGGCACALEARGARGGWGTMLGLLGAALVWRRRRPARRW